MDEIDLARMPLLEHLRELRRRLIASLVAVGVAMLLTTGFAPMLWKLLVRPLQDALLQQGHGSVTVTTPLEGVMVYLRIGVITGLLLASPFVFHQIWMFVAPGLYHKERRWVLPLVLASTLLFLGGASFGYFVVFRYAFAFFLSLTEGTAESLVSMQAYLDTASRLLLGFGASFQLPVIVFFLARIGLVDASDLVRWTRYSVVAILVVAAMLTPPDVISQVLMALPLLVLYGVSIIIAHFVSTKGRGRALERGP
jgi:sec-independent protein translocase protein TatC